MNYSNNENIPLAKLCHGKGEYGIGASAVPKSPNLPTYLRITDITDNGDLITEGLTSVDHVDSSKYYLEENDIVFARTGASTGRAFFYEKKYGRLVYAGFLIKFSINEKKVNPKYLKYYTLSDQYKGWVKAYTGGSTRGNINAKTFGELSIELPPRNQQDFLVKVLSSLDDKIELNNKINKNLEELAQTLYKRWFVDFEFPNEDGEPYKSSGGEMVESELGLIPKGWNVKTIDEITIFNKRGIAPKYTDDGSGIPVINQRCIRNHTIIEEAVQYHNPDAKKTPAELFHSSWDVLINSMGVGTLGRLSISSIEHKKLVHSCITILRPNTRIILHPIFAYMMLSFEDKFIQMGEGTTGQTSLNNKLLGQMKVVVPPIILQDSISNTINSLQNLIDNNYLENERLAKTRNELLPKLMSGEIEVAIEE